MNELENRMVYIIGSLKNKNVPIVANKLREAFPNWEIFDSWFSPGPDADDYWRDYEKGKGLSYREALHSWAGQHVFEFDKKHLDRATDVVMVMPAGKSCHLEMGYAMGRGKRGFVLFEEEPERYDVMYQFCTSPFIFLDINELIEYIKD